VFTETTGGARADRPTLEQVLDILARLQAARVWIGGGWGIDALVGGQTRPHDDLHLAIDTGNEAEAI
jgi:aminoglycoside-2''-adenylyltransferase